MSLSKLKSIVFIILVFAVSPVSAQVAPACQESSLVTDGSKTAATQTAGYPNLKIQAKVAADAFMAADYNKFVDLVYPKIVKLAGGREALIALVTGSMRDMEAQGLKVISYEPGEPEPAIRIDQALYAIVPATMRAQAKVGVVRLESFMIGVSSDDGENWTFVGGAGATDEEQLRAVMPEVLGKLKIPEKKKPILERNQ